MAGITIPSHVLFAELEGETVLLDSARSRYYGLDEVGTRAWQLWAERGDTELAVTTLLAEFDVDEATLRRELGDLLIKLAAKGLVRLNGPIAPQ